jgi:murein DD-endopeptidase MepM/ murein hydrolase activator NlpD
MKKKNNTKRNLLLLIFAFISLRFLSKRKFIDYSNLTKLDTKINSGYGYRNGIMHRGIDFKANSGTKLVLLKKGVVTKINDNWSSGSTLQKDLTGWGNYITIQHPNNVQTRYAHFSKIYVKEGDQINYPQIIGETGTTGNSTGDHLHWEYLINNQRKNGAGKENQFFSLYK